MVTLGSESGSPMSTPDMRFLCPVSGHFCLSAHRTPEPAARPPKIAPAGRAKQPESRGKSRRACRPNPKCVLLVAEFRLLVMPGWRICMQDLRLVGVHDDGEHLLLS